MKKISILKIVKKVAGKHFSDPGNLPEYEYPVPKDMIEIFDVHYRGRDDNILSADIYRPKETADTDEKLPVIILIHGGGLFAGHPLDERPAAEAFARRGYLVFVPSYRKVSSADACGEIADICAAFDFVLSEAQAYGGDPGNAYVIAESAGAYLATFATAMSGSVKLRNAIGYDASELKIRAIAFVSGMLYTTRRDMIGLVYSPEIYRERRKDKAFMELMDPENPEVTENLPPAILTTSRNDFLRKNTIRFAEALTNAGRKCKLIYYAEKDKRLAHAYVTMWPDLPESIDASDKIDEWFRRA